MTSLLPLSFKAHYSVAASGKTSVNLRKSCTGSHVACISGFRSGLIQRKHGPSVNSRCSTSRILHARLLESKVIPPIMVAGKGRREVHCRANEKNAVADRVDEVTKSGGEDWIPLLTLLFAAGLGLGPPLDGIHSQVQLQIYDNSPLVLGSPPLVLYTSAWVYPLLGAFYAVGGALHPVLDTWLAPDDDQEQKGLLGHSWPVVALSFGVLAVLLELSAALYSNGTPYSVIFSVLGLCAVANWWAFERTWWGFALAAIIGISAPLAEIVLMRLLNVWHYPGADVFLGGQGVVSWVVWCYFFYTPALGKLARRLRESVS